MIFERVGGGRLLISETALVAIDTHRQRSLCKPESGGVLLGRLIVGSSDVVVDSVTEPSAKDRRGRYFFRRARRPAQRAVNTAWSGSMGSRNYLGEWHTHPEDDPQPSDDDLTDWRRLARVARFEQEALFFLIAGRVQVRVWEVARGDETVVPLAAHLPTPDADATP